MPCSPSLSPWSCWAWCPSLAWLGAWESQADSGELGGVEGKTADRSAGGVPPRLGWGRGCGTWWLLGPSLPAWLLPSLVEVGVQPDVAGLLQGPGRQVRVRNLLHCRSPALLLHPLSGRVGAFPFPLWSPTQGQAAGRGWGVWWGQGGQVLTGPRGELDQGGSEGRQWDGQLGPCEGRSLGKTPLPSPRSPQCLLRLGPETLRTHDLPTRSQFRQRSPGQGCGARCSARY